MAQVSIYLSTSKYLEQQQLFAEGNPIISESNKYTILTYDFEYINKHIDIFNQDYINICMVKDGKDNIDNCLPESDYTVRISSEVVEFIVRNATPEFIIFINDKAVFDEGIADALCTSIYTHLNWHTISRLFYDQLSITNQLDYSSIMYAIITDEQDRSFEQYLDFINHVQIDYSIESKIMDGYANYSLTLFVKHSTTYDNFKLFKHHLNNIRYINSSDKIMFDIEFAIMYILATERFEFVDILLIFYELNYENIINKKHSIFMDLSITSLRYLHDIVNRFEFTQDSILKWMEISTRYSHAHHFAYLATMYPLFAVEVSLRHQLEGVYKQIVDEINADNQVLLRDMFA